MTNLTNEQLAKCREAFDKWAVSPQIDACVSNQDWLTWQAAWSAAQTRSEQVVSLDDAQSAFYQEMRRQGFATNDIDHIDSGDIVKAVLTAAKVKWRE